MPRNPAKNKRNDPKWWDARLRKTGLAKGRGLNPRRLSYVGTTFPLVAIEGRNEEQKTGRTKATQKPDNALVSDHFDRKLILLWEAPGFSAPTHETYLHYCAWCFALGVRPTSELFYHDIATRVLPRTGKP